MDARLPNGHYSRRREMSPLKVKGLRSSGFLLTLDVVDKKGLVSGILYKKDLQKYSIIVLSTKRLSLYTFVKKVTSRNQQTQTLSRPLPSPDSSCRSGCRDRVDQGRGPFW